MRGGGGTHLKLLVGVVDAQLFKSVPRKVFEAKDVEDTDEAASDGSRNASAAGGVGGAGVRPLALHVFVELQDEPVEEARVDFLAVGELIMGAQVERGSGQSGRHSEGSMEGGGTDGSRAHLGKRIPRIIALRQAEWLDEAIGAGIASSPKPSRSDNDLAGHERLMQCGGVHLE